MIERTSHRTDYAAILERLHLASVNKHYDAYTDIAWDAPEYRIDAEDPRWILPLHDPLGATEWYQRQPLATRARMGLDLASARHKIGTEFESVLSRGLLVFSAACPNGSAAYRYAYHELIEEAQHSLMFQEFVNRSGSDPQNLPPLQRWFSGAIPGLGRRFPALFFVIVLGGEVPIDSIQRRELRHGRELHPLLERIMQIHVTEEARHVCFAEHYLREHLPQLSPIALARLRWIAPFITREMTRLILRTPSWLLERHRVPVEVRREAQRGAVARREMAEMLQPLLDLYSELGIITGVTAPLWHALGYRAARPKLSGGASAMLIQPRHTGQADVVGCRSSVDTHDSDRARSSAHCGNAAR